MATRIREAEGVVAAEPVTGDFDVIAVVEGPGPEAVSRALGRIATVEGVDRAVSRVVIGPN